MMIRYHLRTGDVVEHRRDEATVQEVTDFHDQVFKDMGDDARLTLDTDHGVCIIRVCAIEWIEIMTEGGG